MKVKSDWVKIISKGLVQYHFNIPLDGLHFNVARKGIYTYCTHNRQNIFTCTV